jgi:tetratricopeptide (TPR) repeat protein
VWVAAIAIFALLMLSGQDVLSAQGDLKLRKGKTPEKRTEPETAGGGADSSKERRKKSQHGPKQNIASAAERIALTDKPAEPVEPKAAEIFKEQIAANPDDARLHYSLAYTYYRAGLFEQAIEPFKRAVQLDPSNATWHWQLGQTYRRIERPQEAIESFRQAVAANPNYDVARYDLAVLALKLGDTRTAREQLAALKAASSPFASQLERSLRAETLRRKKGRS